MREHLKDCRRIVVKVGTSTITYPNGRLNLKRVEELAWVLTDLRNRGQGCYSGFERRDWGRRSAYGNENTPDCCARKAGGGSCGTGNADADLS